MGPVEDVGDLESFEQILEDADGKGDDSEGDEIATLLAWKA